jgi:hypothetical protein
MRIITVALLISFVGCSLLDNKLETKPVEEAQIDHQYKVESVVINAGEAEYITLQDSPLFGDGGVLDCKGKELPYYRTNKGVHFYLVETYFSKKEPFSCFWIDDDLKTEVLRIAIGSKKYPSERLYVDKKRVSLNAKDLKRAIKEKDELNIVYSNGAKKPYFRGPFINPLNSKITSVYGSQRVYNDHKTGQHLGVDFRARTPVPLKVTNRGRVVYVKDLFFTGGTVVVDHGLGIFSLYAHMSKFSVSVGDILEQGDVIGLSGATGRVTGPHLHWGVKIHNHWINGLTLVETSKKHIIE